MRLRLEHLSEDTILRARRLERAAAGRWRPIFPFVGARRSEALVCSLAVLSRRWASQWVRREAEGAQLSARGCWHSRETRFRRP